MDPSVRAQLLERFSAYLDGVDDTAAPAEQEPGVAPDLYTLLSELAGLKNEVKIESRQVKGALEEFRQVCETLRQDNERLGGELERRGEEVRRECDRDERDLLGELVEVRDRLHAGAEQARRYRPSWLARRGGAGEFVAGMAEGLAMSLRRFDDVLARRGVRALDVVGRAFDPQTMQVGELAEDAAHADGEVLGELRRGFRHRDRLLRPAEVVVNKLERKT